MVWREWKQSSLGRYLEVLTGYADSSVKHAANEARRASRRTVYQPKEEKERQLDMQEEVPEVSCSLSMELDRLENNIQRADTRTLESLLRQCGAAQSAVQGKRVHDLMFRTGVMHNVYLANLLIQMHGSCGQVCEAATVFNRLNPPNTFSWNIMIAAYARNGHLEEARNMFQRAPNKNAVTWNTMIAAYVQRGHSRQALELFEEMDQQASKITFIHVLRACEALGDVDRAEKIHTEMLKLGWNSHVMLSTALFNVFAKHGSLERARSIFDSMQQRDIVSWNSMVLAYAQRGHVKEAMKLFMTMSVRNSCTWNSIIVAYVQSGHKREALSLFKEMDLEGVHATRITFLAVLSACSSLAEGRRIHSEMVDREFAVEVTAGTALVDMYGRCGSPGEALAAFHQVPGANCVVWAALVSAFARNGQGERACEWFASMCQQGLTPNEITFVSLLHACSAGGLLRDGRAFFQSMVCDYGLEPLLEHYACMVDLLGRSGRTASAEELIRSMPFEPDAVPWMSLLAACKIHRDVLRAANAAQEIVRLNPERGAAYSLLANTQSCTYTHG